MSFPKFLMWVALWGALAVVAVIFWPVSLALLGLWLLYRALKWLFSWD